MPDRAGDCLLYHANCFDVLGKLPPGSVDLVLTDPPYGITQCKWDSALDLERLWPAVWRVAKPRAAVVMTAGQPFTTTLVGSQIKQFRHEWVWVKNRGSNFGSVRFGPMREHESVLVFGQRAVTYSPIMEPRRGRGGDFVGRPMLDGTTDSTCFRLDHVERPRKIRLRLRHPSTVQKVNTQVGLHPTQKPVALMEYMIKTYTQPGDLVLDFCMGSGTTGIAAINTGRVFIGVELDHEHYATAHRRIVEHLAKPLSQRVKPPPKRPRRKRKGSPTHQLGLFSCSG